MGFKNKQYVIDNEKLLKEWHYKKNKNLNLEQITLGSHAKVWWQCKHGHEWEAIIKSRSRGSGCPYCAGKRIIPGKTDLVTTHPELAKQWHPTKNGDLLPTDVSFGSNRKVWWQCEHEHEWEAIIKSRSRGDGCLWCSKKRIIPHKTDLVTTHPELAKQWHPTKNGDLLPTDVSFGSNRKVWWQCEHEHEWEAIIGDRSRGDNCPYCSNKKIKQGFNDLATTHPELAKQWHPTKNGDLLPTDVSFGSTKAIWWRCDKGHEWKRSPNGRTSNEAGCPRCASTGTSYPEQCLFYYLSKFFPNAQNRYEFELEGSVVELDIYVPELKLGIEYDGVYWHKNKKSSDLNKSKLLRNELTLVRVRENGLSPIEGDYCIFTGLSETDIETTIKKIFEFISINFSFEEGFINWLRSLDINLARDGIDIKESYILRKKENSLSAKCPDLAKQWHPTKNKGLVPESFSPNSHLNVWWLGECGHEWRATPNSRSRGTNCPYCANQKKLEGFNDLATTHPELVKEWHPAKNGDLLPTDVLAGGRRKVWWLGNCGHEWEATISDRTYGSGCPYCAGKVALKGFNDLATTHPNLAKQWHPTKNGDLLSNSLTSGSNKKVWWLGECGHEWEASINNRSKGSKCPYCANQKVLEGFNDLATTHPDLAKQWHPTKNGDLLSNSLTSGSNKKVWWLGECGHEWEASINNRSRGSKCPYCMNKKILEGFNDLATTHPDLAKQWHPTKNDDLTPKNIFSGSEKVVWWMCENGHEWHRKCYLSVKNPKCPKCK